MSNIIDSIRLSGVTYGIKGSGGTQTIELTQAQYDALVDKDPNTFYVITDAEAGDLTNYYTKSETNTLLGGKADTATTYTKTEVDNAITAATSTKQDTLVSSQNIKTINNESILGSGNIDIQGGGVDVVQTTGTSTTDVMSQDAVTTQLNDKASKSQAVGSYSFGEINSTPFIKLKKVETAQSLNDIYYPKINGKGILSTNSTWAKNNYNFQLVETSAITSSVTSASTDSEIPSAKAVYDALGSAGGGITSGEVETMISAATSGYTARFDEDEEVTAAGLNALNESLSGKQDTLIAGDNITISGNVISASGGGSITIDSGITSGSTNAVENGAIWSATTYNKEVTLEFDNSSRHYSTNFPSGCTTVKVTVPNGTGYINVNFCSGSTNYTVGSATIQKYGSTPNVSMNFTDASYTIDNNDVIITYPASKSVNKVRADNHLQGAIVKAVVEGVWVNENTYMMSEVDGKIKALDDKKLDATAYTPTVVDSQLNAASTNPVQNQALYDELVIEGAEEETTLTFTGTSPNYKSTNYPSGCTKVKITSPSNSAIRYYFYPSRGGSVGYVDIFKYGSISVSLAFDGASYSIDGGDVIITYPTVTNVDYIAPDAADVSGITVKAITTQTTHLIDQVTANTTSISGLTDRIGEDEEVTAAALNTLNDALGGMKLVKLTQTEYDNLSTKDSNTLYVING